ncbi:MAG: diacylglycerol kinase family lipid kinase [Clostridia bacterium]|nr:diacylglycerol kinase family lipid kinase [Clostridia bacterium]
MKHIFIINPIAGNKKADNVIPKIESYFKTHGGSYEIVFSEYAHHATDIAREFCKTGEQLRIYACGGDGTLFDVLNGAVGYDNAEVGVIPCGSGNDFLKTYSDFDSFYDIAGQVNGSSVPTDLIKFEDKYSINICSMGLDAEVVNHKNHMRFLTKISGSFAYTFSVFTAFLFNIRNRFTVTVDDEEPIKGDFLFTVAANGKFYGGGYMPAPDASTTDGLMDVVLIKTVSRLRILTLLGKYRRGEHIHITDLCKIKLAKKLVVEGEKEMSVNLDGEIFRRNKAVFEIVEDAVKFIVPSVVTVKDPEFSDKNKRKNQKTAVALDVE